MAAYQSQITCEKQTAGYGTANAAAPTRGIEFEDFNLKLMKEPIESSGIRPGRSTISETQILMVDKGTEGSASFQLGARDHGQILENLFGKTVVTTGAGPYTHVFERASNAGKALQFQGLVAYDTANSGATMNWIDTKVMGGTIGVEVDDYVTVGVDLRGRTEVKDTPALAAAVFATSQNLFPYSKVTVTIDGTTTCVSSIEWNFDNNMTGDRYKICPTGFDEPAPSGPQQDTVTLSGVQFNDLTQYDRFRASSFHNVTMTCVGRTGSADTFTLVATKCMLTGNPLPDMAAGETIAEVDLEFRIVTPAAGGSSSTATLVTGQATI